MNSFNTFTEHQKLPFGINYRDGDIRHWSSIVLEAAIIIYLSFWHGVFSSFLSFLFHSLESLRCPVHRI